jgi:hypothetical protein
MRGAALPAPLLCISRANWPTRPFFEPETAGPARGQKPPEDLFLKVFSTCDCRGMPGTPGFFCSAARTPPWGILTQGGWVKLTQGVSQIDPGGESN